MIQASPTHPQERLLPLLILLATIAGITHAGDSDVPLWSAGYDATEFDGYYDAAQLLDGSWILVGWANSQTRLTRVSADGQMLWEKKISVGEDIDSHDHVRSVEATSDGGFAFAMEAYSSFGPPGFGDSDGWLAKFDSAGDPQWFRRIGTPGNDAYFHFTATSDGGYCVAGVVPESDVVIVKFDSLGQPQWQTKIGDPPGPGNLVLQPAGVTRTDDGGCVVAGTAVHQGTGQLDPFAVRLGGTGVVTWQRTYGGIGLGQFWGFDSAPGGGIAIVGATNVFGGFSTNLWLLELDASGDIQWQAAVTPPVGGNDWGLGVARVADGYIVAGNMQDVSVRLPWLLRITTAGSILWEWNLGAHLDDLRGMTVSDDGSFMAVGYRFYDDKGWAMRALSSTGLVDDTCGATLPTLTSVVDLSGDGVVVTNTNMPVVAGGVSVIESTPEVRVVTSTADIECSNGITLEVFSDSFESGDFSGWSAVVP